MKRILITLFCALTLSAQIDLNKQTKGTLPITRGGTGATDAATARTNLGVPTVPVSIANGGTGATDATTARSNLGITSQQEYFAESYNFSRAPSSPASLSPGANSVTLSPCVSGLRTTDALHPLYISTVGTPETTVVAFGNVGACAGTFQIVTILVANSHSAGYTISSATAGIWEAVMDAKAAGGGTVKIPSGTSVLHAHIRLSSNIGLIGTSEAGSTLQVASNTWAAGPAWQHVDGGTVYTIIDLEDYSFNVHIANFTGDMNNVSGITGRVAFIGTSSVNAWHVNIERITTKNWNAGGSGSDANVTVDMYVNTNDSSIDHVTSLGASTACTNSTGFIFVQSQRVSVTNNYATNTCDEAYVTNGPSSDVSFIGNVWLNGSANNHAVAYHIEGSNNSRWIGNSAVDPYNSVAALINVNGSDIIVANNYLEGGGTAQNGQLGAIMVQSPTVRRVSITGNIIKNVSTTGILLTGDIKDSIISGNIISNVSGGSGQQACITVLLFGQSVNLTGISITNNHIDHCGNSSATNDAGIAIFNVDQTAFTISSITIADNIIDDSTGAVTDYGIWSQAPSLSFTNFIIHDNLIKGGVVTPFSLVGLASFDPLQIHHSKGFDDLLPTVSSCGSSPSMVAGSSRHGGLITAGSGTVTACTITFPAFPYAPSCLAAAPGAGLGTGAGVVSISATSATFGFTANAASQIIYYLCH